MGLAQFDRASGSLGTEYTSFERNIDFILRKRIIINIVVNMSFIL